MNSLHSYQTLSWNPYYHKAYVSFPYTFFFNKMHQGKNMLPLLVQCMPGNLTPIEKDLYSEWGYHEHHQAREETFQVKLGFLDFPALCSINYFINRNKASGDPMPFTSKRSTMFRSLNHLPFPYKHWPKFSLNLIHVRIFYKSLHTLIHEGQSAESTPFHL